MRSLKELLKKRSEERKEGGRDKVTSIQSLFQGTQKVFYGQLVAPTEVESLQDREGLASPSFLNLAAHFLL